MVYRYPKRQSENYNIWIIIGLSLFILIFSCIFAYLFFFKTPADIDKAKNGELGTLCPLVNGKPKPNNHSLVLVDTTDSIDEVQLAALENNINEILSQLAPGDLLSIYTLSGTNTKSSEPVFEKCLIRDGSDADALTENEKKMRKTYIEGFEKPLQKAITYIGNEAKKAKVSPIFERIQFLGLSSLDHWNVEGNRNLYIFSDMLQNTPSYSMFKIKDNNYESFKKTSYAVKVKSSLNNVNVEIYRFNNRPELQKNSNSLFWKAYFKDSGAHLMLIKNLGSDTLSE